MELALMIVIVFAGIALVALAAAVFFVVRLPHMFRAERERVAEHVSGQKDIVKEMIDSIRQELVRSQEHLSRAERERIGEFHTMKTVFEEYKTITSGLQESTESLRNVLSNNQLRGQWGEEIAERLLRSVGFVKGQHYTTQTSQEHAATRPDITLKMPDGTKINVDVKFPYQSFRRYVEAEDDGEKAGHMKQFVSDVRQKVREITTRDYINPEEDTVDFVILFVPNEIIFSFIYEHMGDVWDEAFQKKVIMAGPFSFTAILRTFHTAYQTFSTQQNLRHILKDIRTFEKEYEKYTEEVNKLGDRIDSVARQYKAVAETRDKKLARVMEKIRHDDTLDEPQLIENDRT